MRLRDEVGRERVAVQEWIAAVVVLTAKADVSIGAQAQLDELVRSSRDELVGIEGHGDQALGEIAVARQGDRRITAPERASAGFRSAEILVRQAEVEVVEDHGIAHEPGRACLEVETNAAIGIVGGQIAEAVIAEDLLLLVLEARQRVGDARPDEPADALGLAIERDDVRAAAAVHGLREQLGNGGT